MRNNGKKRWIKKSKHESSNKTLSRLCNLCGQEFRLRTVFDRYCPICKNESELLKFSEWLPEIDQVIQEKISA